MKYKVEITIYNSFEVEANSEEEEAETKVREFSDRDILYDSDFNVNYIDKEETK